MKDFIEEDPFLCPECARVGYCINRQLKKSAAIEKIANEYENIPATNQSIEVMVEQEGQ
jgi:hypothetical protein